MRSGFVPLKSDGPGNLAGTHTTGAGVDVARRTVHDRLYTLDIGFPSSVRTTMGVGNLNTERNTFAADVTFCHVSAPPLANLVNSGILTDLDKKSKGFFYNFFVGKMCVHNLFACVFRPDFV